jgi:hypothetical protein
MVTYGRISAQNATVPEKPDFRIVQCDCRSRIAISSDNVTRNPGCIFRLMSFSNRIALTLDIVEVAGNVRRDRYVL